MRIFISYPREFEESAEKIYWELLSLGFWEVFLDKETLHIGDHWKVEIEKRIREANVFIILYDPGAEKDTKRYFCRELRRIKERIKEQCENIEKLIIPVLFPPTKEKDLPAYLHCRNAIVSAGDGRTMEAIDPSSIDAIIRRVEGLKKEKQDAESSRYVQNKKRLKYMLAFALPIAAILILVGVHRIVQGSSGQETCESLKGKYRLRGSYTYLEVPGIRSTSFDGEWTAHSCKKHPEQEGVYELEGSEWTKQKIEVMIEKEYQLVAYARNESNSVFTISKAGGLVDRKILYPKIEKPAVEPDDLSKRIWKVYESRIREMLQEYEKYVVEKHRKAHDALHCIPTRGKNGDSQDIIASVCPSDPPYVRVMEKIPAIIQSR